MWRNILNDDTPRGDNTAFTDDDARQDHGTHADHVPLPTRIGSANPGPAALHRADFMGAGKKRHLGRDVAMTADFDAAAVSAGE